MATNLPRYRELCARNEHDNKGGENVTEGCSHAGKGASDTLWIETQEVWQRGLRHVCISKSGDSRGGQHTNVLVFEVRPPCNREALQVFSRP